MTELRLEELSASTIVAVNSLSLKPGQEQFVAPVSYGTSATVVNPRTTWQRVALDRNEVVGFISANFDPDEVRDYFRAVLWRINVDADDQGRGVGRFLIESMITEAKARGTEQVYVVYETGDEGPQAFFERVGFEPFDETEFGETIARFSL